jgi:DNA polymerase-3 subunit delta
MADLKPAYFFFGDDEVKIDQARKRLAARAEKDGATLESISGATTKAAEFATILTSPSLLPGTRFVLADGVDSWKAADVGPVADALKFLPEMDAVAVLIGRKKPLKAISEAIEAVGGEAREFKEPPEKQLPGWLAEQAKTLGVEIERPAAELLVTIVGKPPKRAPASQQWSQKRRLLTELEKLACAAGAGGQINSKLVQQNVHGESAAEVFDLTDHAVAGARSAAIADAEKLIETGEPSQRIVAMLARSFGQVQTVAALNESGRGAEIAEKAGIQPWLAKKLSAQAAQRGGRSIRDALVELARLDSAVKGGSALDNETELMRSIEKITK